MFVLNARVNVFARNAFSIKCTNMRKIGELQNNVAVNMQNETANENALYSVAMLWVIWSIEEREERIVEIAGYLVAVKYVIFWLSYNFTTYLMLREPEILKSTQHSNNSNHSIRELCVRWWKKVTQNVYCLTKLLLLPMGISNFCLLSRIQSYCYYVSGVMRPVFVCVFSFHNDMFYWI